MQVLMALIQSGNGMQKCGWRVGVCFCYGSVSREVRKDMWDHVAFTPCDPACSAPH